MRGPGLTFETLHPRLPAVMRLLLSCHQSMASRSHRGGVSGMPEPKGSDVRTLAVRVSPDYHAQLSMVAQVDGVSLTDLMMQGPGQPHGRTSGGSRLQGQGSAGARRRRSPDGQ